MKLTRNVALNGVWLDDVDNRIVISAVEPADGKENISATNSASGFGSRVTQKYRSMVDVVVRFRILERGRSTNGMSERSEVLEKVNAWASAGGILTVNYKPGRRLNVILVQAPGEGSLWDYTKEFSMTLRAYTIPYWEDSTESSETCGGSSATGSASLTVGGSVKTQCNVEVKNVSESTINELTVTAGGNQMSFTGLALASNETLVIDHNNGLLRIMIKDTNSVYRNVREKRTGANDMTLEPGTRFCSYSAEHNCTLTVKWRARYL